MLFANVCAGFIRSRYAWEVLVLLALFGGSITFGTTGGNVRQLIKSLVIFGLGMSLSMGSHIC